MSGTQDETSKCQLQRESDSEGNVFDEGLDSLFNIVTAPVKAAAEQIQDGLEQANKEVQQAHYKNLKTYQSDAPIAMPTTSQ